ncbi:MAG: hypothetical protein ACTSRA_13090 [Promethearchaeota archaeon]
MIFLRLGRILKKAIGEHFAVTLSVVTLAIVSSMLLLYFFNPSGTKRDSYSAIGLLNADHELGLFPKNVTTSGTLELYFNVINHEGRIEYYEVRVFLASQDQVIDPVRGSINGTSFGNYSRVIDDGGVWEEFLAFNFTEFNVGFNKRLIFELWMFDQSLMDFVFDQHVYIWIDII